MRENKASREQDLSSLSSSLIFLSCNMCISLLLLFHFIFLFFYFFLHSLLNMNILSSSSFSSILHPLFPSSNFHPNDYLQNDHWLNKWPNKLSKKGLRTRTWSDIVTLSSLLPLFSFFSLRRNSLLYPILLSNPCPTITVVIHGSHSYNRRKELWEWGKASKWWIVISDHFIPWFFSGGVSHLLLYFAFPRVHLYIQLKVCFTALQHWWCPVRSHSLQSAPILPLFLLYIIMSRGSITDEKKGEEKGSKNLEKRRKSSGSSRQSDLFFLPLFLLSLKFVFLILWLFVLISLIHRLFRSPTGKQPSTIKSCKIWDWPAHQEGNHFLG